MIVEVYLMRIMNFIKKNIIVLKMNIIKFYRDKFNDIVYDDFDEFKLTLSTSLEPIRKH